MLRAMKPSNSGKCALRSVWLMESSRQTSASSFPRHGGADVIDRDWRLRDTLNPLDVPALREQVFAAVRDADIDPGHEWEDAIRREDEREVFLLDRSGPTIDALSYRVHTWCPIRPTQLKFHEILLPDQDAEFAPGWRLSVSIACVLRSRSQDSDGTDSARAFVHMAIVVEVCAWSSEHGRLDPDAMMRVYSVRHCRVRCISGSDYHVTGQASPNGLVSVGPFDIMWRMFASSPVGGPALTVLNEVPLEYFSLMDVKGNVGANLAALIHFYIAPAQNTTKSARKC
jgi:hypothetical protein